MHDADLKMFSVEKGTLTRGSNMSNLDSSIEREINNTEGCMITAAHDGSDKRQNKMVNLMGFQNFSSNLQDFPWFQTNGYPSLDPHHLYTAAHQQRFQGLAIAVHHRRSFRRLQHRCLADQMHVMMGSFFRRRTNPFMAWIWDSGPSIFA